MPENSLTTQQNNQIIQTPDEAQLLAPTREELDVLNGTEKFGFWLTDKMNYGVWKKLMTFFQRHIGSLWIHLATYNIMNLYGLENFEKTDVSRPVLLVANHRSFFDMYAVSAMLFRRTKRPMTLYFPVRAKFFYTSPLGWFVNFIMGWFAMYPPFFREEKDAEKREFDKFSLRKVIRLCSEGKAHVIGFHPEGKRNLNDDPYEFLPAQPGIGKIILAAKPQVVPVFIAGLQSTDLKKQVLGNWRGGEKIRIHFGEPLDLAQFYGKRDALRTHKEIADFLMTKIGELAEQDKTLSEIEIQPNKI
jgi:1-acyl-sn-glycerol-3-phosphate acyltransferase